MSSNRITFQRIEKGQCQINNNSDDQVWEQIQNTVGNE
jgi:hypothetical protein